MTTYKKRPVEGLYDNNESLVGFKGHDGREYGGLVPYAPSGGDDSPGMLANFNTNGGILKLAHGQVYKINTPLLLEGGVKYLNGFTVTYAPQIVCDGMAILDTSGCGKNTLKIHDTYKITGLSNASPCVVTLDATTPLPGSGGAATWVNGETRLIDGTRIYIQTPSSTQACVTWEAINGISSAGNATGYYIKTVSTTSFQLYLDAALTLPLDTTSVAEYPAAANTLVTNNVTENSVTWDTKNAWFMRRYYGNYNYTPAIRLVGSVWSSPDRNNTMFARVAGVTMRNVSNAQYANFNEYNGVGLAIENNLAYGAGGLSDTKTAQVTSFERVHFEGYAIDMVLDDCTNVSMVTADFSNSYIGIGVGYNLDLVECTNIRFGSERFIAGTPLIQGFQLSPVYYAPNNVYKPSPGQTNCLSLNTIWVNTCHDIIGDVNPKSVEIKGIYPERGRTIGLCNGGGVLTVHGSHFSTFSYGVNLLNNETVFGTYESAHLFDNEGDAVPKYGWVSVKHNSSDEQFVTRLNWENNRLQPGTSGGHIKYNMFDGVTSLATGYVTLKDDNDSGVENNRPACSVQFAGATQVGGEPRWNRVAAATGTFDPVLENYTSFELTLTGALTIRNPCSRSDKPEPNGLSFLDQHHAGAAKRLYKMLDLFFILKQDATGLRAVTFNTAYVTTGFVNGAAATAGQKSLVQFKWNGSKWQMIMQTAWA